MASAVPFDDTMVIRLSGPGRPSLYRAVVECLESLGLDPDQNPIKVYKTPSGRRLHDTLETDPYRG